MQKKGAWSSCALSFWNVYCTSSPTSRTAPAAQSESPLTGQAFRDCPICSVKSHKDHLFSFLVNNVTVYQYVRNVLSNFKLAVLCYSLSPQSWEITANKRSVASLNVAFFHSDKEKLCLDWLLLYNKIISFIQTGYYQHPETMATKQKGFQF